MVSEVINNRHDMYLFILLLIQRTQNQIMPNNRLNILFSLKKTTNHDFMSSGTMYCYAPSGYAKHKDNHIVKIYNMDLEEH